MVNYSISCKNLIAPVSAICCGHAHVPLKNCLFTRNGATPMPGKALDVAATFFRKFVADCPQRVDPCWAWVSEKRCGVAANFWGCTKECVIFEIDPKKMKKKAV